MSIAQWNNFTNYIIGNQVQNGSSQVYACILANKNRPPPNVTYWNPVSPSVSGVASLSGLTGAITQACNAGTYTNVGQVNRLTLTIPPTVTSDRASSTAATLITATTAATAQVLLTLTVNPSVASDLNISALMSFNSQTAGSNTIIVFVSVNGSQVGGQYRVSSTSTGPGTFVSPSVLASTPTTAGSHVVRLLAYASASGAYVQSVSQLVVLSNVA